MVALHMRAVINCLFNNPKSGGFFPRSHKGKSVEMILTVFGEYRRDVLSGSLYVEIQRNKENRLKILSLFYGLYILLQDISENILGMPSKNILVLLCFFTCLHSTRREMVCNGVLLPCIAC